MDAVHHHSFIERPLKHLAQASVKAYRSVARQCLPCDKNVKSGGSVMSSSCKSTPRSRSSGETGAEVQAVELKPSSGNEDKLACGDRDPSVGEVAGPSDSNTLEMNF